MLGFTQLGEENGWTRFGFDNAARACSTSARRPDARRGAWGVGSVHHLAWRVDDEAHQLAVRGAGRTAGRQPTPVIDRFWFKSVYFQEPGGVLFELATDGPGFAVDEDARAPRRDARAAAVARAARAGDRGRAAGPDAGVLDNAER